MRVRPYRTTENAIEGLVVTFVEITDQKETQSKLVKFKQAVQQSPSAVMITDTGGKIEYVNPKFSTITGFGYDEVIGKKPNILKSGKHPQRFYKQMWKTISSGKEWSGEIHNRKKDGELYWEAARISPVRDDRGTVTHFVAIKEDVTARKKALQGLERKVEQRNAALTEANEILEQEISKRKEMEEAHQKNHDILDVAFSTIHIMIAYLEKDFSFVRVNRAYAEANGKGPESFVGKHYFDLFPNDSQTREVFERVLETGETVFIFAKPGGLPNNPGGEGRFYDWIIQPVSEHPGGVSGLLLSIIDVTEREKEKSSG